MLEPRAFLATLETDLALAPLRERFGYDAARRAEGALLVQALERADISAADVSSARAQRDTAKKALRAVYARVAAELHEQDRVRQLENGIPDKAPTAGKALRETTAQLLAVWPSVELARALADAVQADAAYDRARDRAAAVEKVHRQRERAWDAWRTTVETIARRDAAAATALGLEPPE